MTEPDVYFISTMQRRRRSKKPLPVLNGPTEVYSFMRRMVQHLDREHLFGIYLTAKNAVIDARVIAIGSLTANVVHPREVYKPAVTLSAASLVLVHNHPSGDPTPSDEDVSTTRRLAEAGDILGIRLLDHLVIGSTGYVSIREFLGHDWDGFSTQTSAARSRRSKSATKGRDRRSKRTAGDQPDPQ